VKKSAILIVNGFDRRHRWGTYKAAEAKAYPWIEICLRQIQRHSSGSLYDVLIYDNACLLQHRRIMARFPETRVFPAPTAFFVSNILESLFLGRVSRCFFELSHPVALDFLVDQLANDYEYFITLDTDAFPIQDGWIEFLTSTIEQGCAVVGVYRNEMSEVLPPFIHVSCLCMRVSDFCQLPVSFGKQIMKDIGQNITMELCRREAGIGCLERTNRVERHFLMAGVYGNLIYHHGAGSRNAFFWSSRDLPQEVRQQDEKLNVVLRDRVFRNLDSHIENLLGAQYGRLPSPTVRVLQGGGYPVLAQPS